MTWLPLVRHGQSEWNAEGRWQGQADPPLTELGRQQAAHAALALGTFDMIAASDLRRAAETAAIIATELAIEAVSTDPGLRERHAGEWEGLTRADIERDWPGYLDEPAPDDSGERRRPPGWEPDDALVTRALGALARIEQQAPQGEALIVTHGGLVYALEASLGATFERLPNLAGRWIEVVSAGLGRLGERVTLVDPAELTIPNQL